MFFRRTFTLLLSLLIGTFTSHARAAIPTSSHSTMTKHLESGIEWAKHLRDETKKGRKLSPTELDGDLAGVESFLTAMDLTSNEILRQSPHEKTEGQFTEMRRFQEIAKVATSKFRSARQEQPRPNYSKMKSAAKEILHNLEEAKHWHDLELSEIEINPKD